MTTPQGPAKCIPYRMASSSVLANNLRACSGSAAGSFISLSTANAPEPSRSGGAQEASRFHCRQRSYPSVYDPTRVIGLDQAPR